jgi:hypothetical protein
MDRFGLWRIVEIFNMILDVAQFWRDVSGPSNLYTSLEMTGRYEI